MSPRVPELLVFPVAISLSKHFCDEISESQMLATARTGALDPIVMHVCGAQILGPIVRAFLFRNLHSHA